MTNATLHPPAAADESLPPGGLEGLATATLHASLRYQGYQDDGAHAEYRRAGDSSRLVLHLSPSVPWRVAQSALVQAVAALRRFDPGLAFTDGTFEAIEGGTAGPSR